MSPLYIGRIPVNCQCVLDVWRHECLLFSRRFSGTCLEEISFNFFVCFFFNWSIWSAPKKKHHYLTLYQNWNRTPVYLELAVSASYVNKKNGSNRKHFWQYFHQVACAWVPEVADQLWQSRAGDKLDQFFPWLQKLGYLRIPFCFYFCHKDLSIFKVIIKLFEGKRGCPSSCSWEREAGAWTSSYKCFQQGLRVDQYRLIRSDSDLSAMP